MIPATMLSQTHAAGKAPRADPTVILPYVVFFIGGATLYHAMESGFSSTLTLSAGLQCLAFVLLTVKLQSQRATTGLSGKMLMLYATTLCFRLSSTVWLNGYLPVDKTGDWAYQAIEICCLSLVAYLMRCVFVTHRATYQEQHDSIPVKLQHLVLGCFIFAVVVHPHLDRRELFDILWTTGCYLETLAMLPQLWMLSKIGEVESLTSHFVVLSFLSRVCSLLFWYTGFKEMAPPNGGINFPGAGVVGAHILQLLLSGDFVFLYLKNIRRRCMSLPTTWEV
jgi:hypothetical protein